MGQRGRDHFWGAASAWLAFAAIMAGPASLRASEGEHALSVALGYASALASGDGAATGHGVGAAVSYRYGADDFVSLLIEGGHAATWGGAAERGHASHVRFGATWAVDAVTWVPWWGATLGIHLLPRDPRPIDVGFAAGVGLDYRPARTWAVGAEVWYHLLAYHLGESPGLLWAGLRLTIFFID